MLFKRLTHAVWPWMASTGLLAGFALSCYSASANPVVPQPIHGSITEMIAFIAAVNFFVDLLFTSLFLLATWSIVGHRIGGISKNSLVFVLLLVASVVVIAIVGAGIDLAVLYEESDGVYHSRIGDVGSLDNSLLDLTYGTILVFATIYFAYAVMMRVDWRIALAPAAAMALVSPFSWILIGTVAVGPVLFLTVFFVTLVLDTIFILMLVRMHERHFSGTAPPASAGKGRSTS